MTVEFDNIVLSNGDVVGHEFHGNQYSEARGAALRASDEAHRSHGAEDNRKAAEAHRRAAAMATSAGSKKFHEAMAAGHDKAVVGAEEHARRMGYVRKSAKEFQSRLDATPEGMKAKLRDGIAKAERNVDRMQRSVESEERHVRQHGV